MTLAIVPARCGSKGIPHKNIAICAGKPLVMWTMDALYASSIRDVVVSTDCSHLLPDMGENGPLFTKRIGDDDQIEDRLDVLIQQYNPEIIVLLQPTSPVRTGKQIDEAIEQLQREKADSLVSVVPDHSLVWADMAGTPLPSYDITNRARRQDMTPPHYKETGNIYVFTREHWDKTHCRLGGKVSLYIMPEETGYQVDTPFELWLCSMILERQKTLMAGNVW